MIDSHLLGEVFLQPFVIIHMVVNEAEGVLKLYLHGCLTDLSVVEPCFGEPSYSCLVAIDADETRYVKALDVDVQGGKRIYELTVSYRFRLYFFLRRRPCLAGTYHAAMPYSSESPR